MKYEPKQKNDSTVLRAEALALPLACAAWLVLPGMVQAEPAGYRDNPLATVVVTGNRARGNQRTITDSPSPVDVISAETLKAQSSAGLTQALNNLLPSFNLPAVPGGGSSGIVRPAGLRGLNGDQTLVLVNGKRRHVTSLINISSYMNNGAQPADLDLIPIAAVDHVEILRDGAAAQYGSDAIAGVINIILKNNDSGGQSVTTLGHDYGQGGATATQGLSWATTLPRDGFFNLGLDLRHQDRADSAEAVSGQFYNDPNDPREQSASRHVSWSYGKPRYNLANLSYNAELPLEGETTLYSFSTLSSRVSKGGGRHVRPNSASNNLDIYPDGFLPTLEIEERDAQVAAGLRGRQGEWDWDLSSTYGVNRAELSTEHDLNLALGNASPKRFDQGTLQADQWTSNLDLTRSLDIGWQRPLDLSFGFEHRYEKYSISKGEAAAAGSSFTSGLGESLEDKRNVFAGYLDLNFYPTERWSFGLAGRVEHYDDDAGTALSGKFSSRYELTPRLALRGTLSNGFRAPSIAQSIYSSSWQRTLVVAPYNYTVQILPVDSPTAKALGAEALDPETSQNLSLGLTYEALDNLRLSVDAYLIKVRDRVVLASLLSGVENPAVRQILDDAGLPSNIYAQYYTNGLDTRTHGVDVVLDYFADYGAYGRVKWGAGLNWNRTKVTDVKERPAALAAVSGYEVYDYEAQSDLTQGSPKSKFVLSANWQIADFAVDLRTTRYGEYFQASASGRAYDRTYGTKWITDLDVSYALSRQLKLAVGANNLFDVYPDKIGPVTATGVNAYGLYSPYGLTGGYYYTRLTYDF